MRGQQMTLNLVLALEVDHLKVLVVTKVSRQREDQRMEMENQNLRVKNL